MVDARREGRPAAVRQTPGVPSWFRDPEAPPPNRPREVGVCFVVELRDGVPLDTRCELALDREEVVR